MVFGRGWRLSADAFEDQMFYLASRGYRELMAIVQAAAITQPITVPLFPLLLGQKSLASSPTGGPAAIATMLNFAARHHIEPTIETYRFSEINDALEKLRHGKPRYRIVLQP